MERFSECDISLLNPYFGAVVKNCDLTNITESEAESLIHFLYSNKLLVFRGVKWSPEVFLDFAKHLGEPVKFVDNEYHHPDHPEIFVVANKFTQGKKMGMDRVGYYWHSDSSFLPEPLPVTSLYCQQAPKEGGETAFISMANVYRNLPEEMQNTLQSLQVRHEGSWRYLITEKDVGLSVQEIVERDEKDVPPPLHPLVSVHPFTGEKSLYLSEGISRRIVNYPLDKGKELLAKLWVHIDKDPSRYVHYWEPGDLVLWDNRGLIHRAYPAAPGNPRLMFRIGIKDGPFFDRRVQ